MLVCTNDRTPCFCCDFECGTNTRRVNVNNPIRSNLTIVKQGKCVSISISSVFTMQILMPSFHSIFTRIHNVIHFIYCRSIASIAFTLQNSIPCNTVEAISHLCLHIRPRFIKAFIRANIFNPSFTKIAFKFLEIFWFNFLLGNLLDNANRIGRCYAKPIKVTHEIFLKKHTMTSRFKNFIKFLASSCMWLPCDEIVSLWCEVWSDRCNKHRQFFHRTRLIFAHQGGRPIFTNLIQCAGDTIVKKLPSIFINVFQKFLHGHNWLTNGFENF